MSEEGEEEECDFEDDELAEDLPGNSSAEGLACKSNESQEAEKKQNNNDAIEKPESEKATEAETHQSTDDQDTPKQTAENEETHALMQQEADFKKKVTNDDEVNKLKEDIEAKQNEIEQMQGELKKAQNQNAIQESLAELTIESIKEKTAAIIAHECKEIEARIRAEYELKAQKEKNTHDPEQNSKTSTCSPGASKQNTTSEGPKIFVLTEQPDQNGNTTAETSNWALQDDMRLEEQAAAKYIRELKEEKKAKDLKEAASVNMEQGSSTDHLQVTGQEKKCKNGEDFDAEDLTEVAAATGAFQDTKPLVPEVPDLLELPKASNDEAIEEVLKASSGIFVESNLTKPHQTFLNVVSNLCFSWQEQALMREKLRKERAEKAAAAKSKGKGRGRGRGKSAKQQSEKPETVAEAAAEEAKEVPGHDEYLENEDDTMKAEREKEDEPVKKRQRRNQGEGNGKGRKRTGSAANTSTAKKQKADGSGQNAKHDPAPEEVKVNEAPVDQAKEANEANQEKQDPKKPEKEEDDEKKEDEAEQKEKKRQDCLYCVYRAFFFFQKFWLSALSSLLAGSN